jgi:hypothetical protein
MDSMKDDGSLILRGEVTPLMRLLLQRRSCRRFGPGRRNAVDTFLVRTGFTAPRIVIVDDPAQFDRVRDAAMAGIVGKINPWLAFTDARTMILCGAVYGEGEQGVERAVMQASMALQVAILAATEAGLGTCWMAGIHHEAVEEAFPLPDGSRLVAMSPLGEPPASMGISWDFVANFMTSRRRKPLDEIRMDETWRAES